MGYASDIECLLVTEQRSAPARRSAEQALRAGAAWAAVAQLQPNREGALCCKSMLAISARHDRGLKAAWTDGYLVTNAVCRRAVQALLKFDKEAREVTLAVDR